MSNLQTYYHFKLDFQKMDQHTGGKWLIHCTKRRKDNQLQAWNSPVEYPSRECKHAIKRIIQCITYMIFFTASRYFRSISRKYLASRVW